MTHDPPITIPPPLWSAEEVGRATGGRVRGVWRAGGVSIDTRTLQPGDLFIALQGPNHDGHDHVADALARGAAAAVVHREPEGVDPGRLVVVQDTFLALHALGRHARNRATSVRVFGVTGSVGKTGTKDMLANALAMVGKVHATRGNLNNHWGVPLTLARMPADTDYAVIEMGMNQAGEIGTLSRLARPDIAIITAIASAHIGNLGSSEAIAEAKAEIFEGLTPGGAAILPRDTRHFRRLAKAARTAGAGMITGFGMHPEADARLVDIALDPGNTRVFMVVGDVPLGYRMGSDGRHWALNSLAVIAGVCSAGLEPARILKSFGDLTPPEGRGQRTEVPMLGGRLSLIDECYNASPASMAAALETLALARPGPGGRRIAVLGDMLELGEAGPAMHGGLAATVMEHGITMVFTAGPLMAHLDEALPAGSRAGHAPSSDALVPMVTAAVRPGDVVMIKGSRGSRMDRVMQALIALGEAAGETAA